MAYYFKFSYDDASPPLRRAITWGRKKIAKAREVCPNLPQDCWIAGGSLRALFAKEPIADVDIYGYNLEEKNGLVMISKVGKYYNAENKIHIIYNGTRFDFIKIPFKNMEDCIEQFDFTVCCCAVNQDYIVYHENFFVDLVGKNLVINQLPDAFGTLKRLRKYIKRGYSIDNQNMFRLGVGLKYFDFNSINKKEEPVVDDVPF